MPSGFVVHASHIEEEGSDLIATAMENSESFLETWRPHGGSTASFLNDRDVNYIALHSTNIPLGEQERLLHASFDIDGLVVRLEGFSGVKMPLHRMHLEVERNMVRIYHKIKKHMRLSSFSASARACMEASFGLVVFRELGFEVSVALLPHATLETGAHDSARRNRKIYSEFFSAFKEMTESAFQGADVADKGRPTLRKNALNDTSFWDIVGSDQAYVLRVLDEALSTVERPRGLEAVVVCWRFGQKEERPVKVSEMFARESIVDMSVHSAVNITCKDMLLFWSRGGLQRLVGRRGTFYSAMSFCEAANFQSNVNGSAMDVKEDLRTIAAYVEGLRFVQLYADLPHRWPFAIGGHPVSGCIATMGLLHPATRGRLRREAAAFINVMRDNAVKIESPSAARIEIVTAIPGNMVDNESVSARDFFNVEQIRHMLDRYPVVVPFSDVAPRGGGERVRRRLTEVATFLVDELGAMLEEKGERGGFRAAWRSLQFEVALERLFRGKMFRPESAQLSINLGPGNDPTDRSATSSRGFLCLEHYSSCAVNEDCPPPVHLWTRNVSEGERICRAFAFADSVDAGQNAVGAKMLVAFLLDVKHANLSGSTLFTSLKSSAGVPHWSRLVGAISVQQLASDLLAYVGRMRYPHVCRRLAEIAAEAGLNVKAAIELGLHEGGFTYFPRIRMHDASRNTKVAWNNVDVVELLAPDGSGASLDAVGYRLSGDVVSLLEVQRFAYARTLQPLRDASELPWIVAALKKLEGENVGEQQMVDLLAYLTCIAMLMNGLYIDYSKLANLHLDMKGWPGRMRRLEILSKFEVPGFNRVRLSRLHSSMPWRIGRNVLTEAPVARKRAVEEEDVEQQEEGGDEGVPPDREQRVVAMPARHVPSCESKRAWSAAEVEILRQVEDWPGRSIDERYSAYLKLCNERQIPHRTWRAFKYKYYATLRVAARSGDKEVVT